MNMVGVRSISIFPFPGYKFNVLRSGFVTKLVFCNSWFKPFKRSFEYKVFSKIESAVSTGDHVVDIGANVGILTLFMSRLVGENGKVYSIEASNRNLELLIENIKLNNVENVIPINYAVSNKKGILYMTSPGEKYNDALLISSNTETINSEKVESLPFDLIAEMYNIKNVKFIKIDIEGAELLFFSGASNFLKKNRPDLIFECLEPYTNRFGHSVIDVLEYLIKLGYHLVQIDQETWYGTYIKKNYE
jgi:FkbM family methyltransferase